MNEKSINEEDDMLPEYDLDALPIIARGPGHQLKEHIKRMTRVTLDPDVAEVFPDDQAVNQALRTLVRLSQAQTKSVPAA